MHTYKHICAYLYTYNLFSSSFSPLSWYSIGTLCFYYKLFCSSREWASSDADFLFSVSEQPSSIWTLHSMGQTMLQLALSIVAQWHPMSSLVGNIQNNRLFRKIDFIWKFSLFLNSQLYVVCSSLFHLFWKHWGDCSSYQSIRISCTHLYLDIGLEFQS